MPLTVQLSASQTTLYFGNSHLGNNGFLFYHDVLTELVTRQASYDVHTRMFMCSSLGSNHLLHDIGEAASYSAGLKIPCWYD